MSAYADRCGRVRAVKCVHAFSVHQRVHACWLSEIVDVRVHACARPAARARARASLHWRARARVAPGRDVHPRDKVVICRIAQLTVAHLHQKSVKKRATRCQSAWRTSRSLASSGKRQQDILR
eukprot:894577-Pleurochrysis_carterae.AAC.2